MEERVERLEESLIQTRAAGETMLGIIRSLDKKADELTGAVRAIQVNGAIIDARLNAMDARISIFDAQMTAVRRDMEASFRQVAATMATKQDLADLENRVGERISTLDSK